MVVIEGIALCFWLLLICVIGIADGPAGLVIFYEKDVQDRTVELGLTTEEKIEKTGRIVRAALFIPILVFVPLTVCFVNGAEGFRDRFIQMTVILLIAGLFDRIFIDWYWVGHTKAWLIPGTEDLRPYIPKQAAVKKWIGTVIGFPLLAALLAWVTGLISG